MKERPILFNAEMVRAILDGRKTQTRRPVPEWQLPSETEGPHDQFPDSRFISTAQRDPRYGFGVFGATAEACMDNYNKGFKSLCPFGAIGDRLWVRETFQGPLIEQGDESTDGYEFPKYCVYKSDGHARPEFTTVDDETVCRWRPSIHMPRWASRITLEITSVRVERVQDISESDAAAEGLNKPIYVQNESGQLTPPVGETLLSAFPTAKHWFSTVWDGVYGNWSENPWVWIVEFKVLTTNGVIREAA
ncbi:MAG: hypothetical protein U5L02_06215 [Rheinheimera sp.]|nr:hypothetical protein [Rheinheimera sp.]